MQPYSVLARIYSRRRRVISSAIALFKATSHPGFGPWLDSSRHGHHARLGSTHTAFIAEDYDGVNCLHLPGTATACTYTPDSNALRVSGDLDLRAVLALDSWTTPSGSGVDASVISKWSGSAGYTLEIQGGSGLMRLLYYNGSVRSVFSSVSPSTVAPAGTIIALRVTVDMNGGGGTDNIITFYTKATTAKTANADMLSDDGWVQLGTQFTIGTTGTAIYTDNKELTLFSNHGISQPIKGRAYAVAIKDGIDGTTVFNADFTKQRRRTAAFLEEANDAIVVIGGKRAVVCDGALHLPRVSSNVAVTASTPELEITGDLEIIGKINLDTWTPATSSDIVGKLASVTSGYEFYVDTNRTLRMVWHNGSTVTGASSTQLVPITSGELWVKGTLDVDNGAGGHTLKFYTSTDGENWTQLGATVTNAGVTQIKAGTDPLYVGSRSLTSNMLLGKVHRAIVKSGIDGTVVFDANFENLLDGTTEFTESSAYGHQVKVLSTAVGEDANDPIFLPFNGTKYAYFPGVNGNYASIPNSAALTITGDIDVRLEVALDDYTPGSQQTMFNKWSSGGGWIWAIHSGGDMTFGWTDGGGVNRSVTCDAVIRAIDKQKLWIRVTLDVDNGAGGHDVKFWTSRDGVTWTQLGTTQNAGAFTTTIGVYTSAVEIGASNAGTHSPCAGKFYRAQVYAGLAGEDLRLDVDFTDSALTGATTSFTEKSSYAATVTVNRSDTGLKTVMVERPTWLLGTQRYFEIPDHADLDFANGEDLTVIAVGRKWGSDGGVIIAKRGNTGAGWRLENDTSLRLSATISDGTSTANNISSSGAFTAGALTHFWMRRDTALDVVQSGVDSTQTDSDTDTTTATLANALAVRVGRGAGSSTDYNDIEIYGIAVIRGALTNEKLAKAKAEILA